MSPHTFLAAVHSLTIFVFHSQTPIVSRISYIAVDGLTGLQSLETAVINVAVQHVNKPPVPTPNYVKYMPAQQFVAVQLAGSDSDNAIVTATLLQSDVLEFVYFKMLNASYITPTQYDLTLGPVSLRCVYPCWIAVMYM